MTYNVIRNIMIYDLQSRIKQKATEVLLENKCELRKYLTEACNFSKEAVDKTICGLNVYKLSDTYLDLSNIHLVSRFIDELSKILEEKIKQLFPDKTSKWNADVVKNLGFVFNCNGIGFAIKDPSGLIFSSIEVLLEELISYDDREPNSKIITLKICDDNKAMCYALGSTFHVPYHGYYETELFPLVLKDYSLNKTVIIL